MPPNPGSIFIAGRLSDCCPPCLHKSRRGIHGKLRRAGRPTRRPLAARPLRVAGLACTPSNAVLTCVLRRRLTAGGAAGSWPHQTRALSGTRPSKRATAFRLCLQARMRWSRWCGCITVLFTVLLVLSGCVASPLPCNKVSGAATNRQASAPPPLPHGRAPVTLPALGGDGNGLLGRRPDRKQRHVERKGRVGRSCWACWVSQAASAGRLRFDT